MCLLTVPPASVWRPDYGGQGSCCEHPISWLDGKAQASVCLTHTCVGTCLCCQYRPPLLPKCLILPHSRDNPVPSRISSNSLASRRDSLTAPHTQPQPRSDHPVTSYSDSLSPASLGFYQGRGWGCLRSPRPDTGLRPESMFNSKSRLYLTGHLGWTRGEKVAGLTWEMIPPAPCNLPGQPSPCFCSTPSGNPCPFTVGQEGTEANSMARLYVY